jgi:hypothetical protein
LKDGWSYFKVPIQPFPLLLFAFRRDSSVAMQPAPKAAKVDLYFQAL